MVERELPAKFDLDPYSSSQETSVTDGRTTGGCAMTVALLTKSSRAKNYTTVSTKLRPSVLIGR